MRNLLGASTALLAAAASCVSAIDLDVTNTNAIKTAAGTIVHGMMSYYTGNVTNTPETVGVLPKPYYWWEAGAMWGALLDYYHYTGDASYNEVLTQALISQVGPNSDFMVPAHQGDEGNDDQAFWGFAAMAAAERNYPQPKDSQYSWVQLVERLWNTQVQRWETDHCGGGLRWQIFASNNGYNYKNTVSNGAFFQLSARLARITGNQTYAEWAEKSYNWVVDVGLVTSDYSVYDGADISSNCTGMTKITWTYNAGIYLYGSAVMYNYTNGSDQWSQRTQGFLTSSKKFFTPFGNATNVMYEGACETTDHCDTDQYSFKGYLSRFMWASTLLAPFTASTVTDLLTQSAQAAAKSCSGPSDGATCGTRWYWGSYDGKYGAGQQMSALETIQGLLASSAAPPLANGKGVTPPSDSTQNTKTAGTSSTPSTSSKSASTASPSHPAQNNSTLALPVTASTALASGSKQNHTRVHSSACSSAIKVASTGASSANSSTPLSYPILPANPSAKPSNGANYPAQGTNSGTLPHITSLLSGTSPSAPASALAASWSPPQQRPMELLMAIFVTAALMLR